MYTFLLVLVLNANFKRLSNNPNGNGLNKNLDPSSSVNYEIGWRKSASNLLLQATAYLINTDNEILPYEIEEFPGKNFETLVRQEDMELNLVLLLFSSGKLNLSIQIVKSIQRL